MAQLQASIDLTGLSITGVQTVRVVTYNVYGVEFELASLTQDFTGYTVSQFINTVRADIVATGNAVAYQESPILRIVLSNDTALFEEQQVDLTFGATSYSASWIKINETGCGACYPLNLFSCYGSYLISLGLTAATAYNIIFTDKFGKKYVDSVTTDGDGAFTINPATYPTGFFTPENGIITMTITDATNEAVNFTVGYTQYECADLFMSNMEAV